MKNKLIMAALGVLFLVALANCAKNEIVGVPVEELTKKGYFTLLESKTDGKYGPVIIFPEDHASRLIQAEIGWALDVLLESPGMNTVALEGMFNGETMNGDKIHYDSDEDKYSVLLAQLETGEIKAPEFMYLAKDSYVFGIEKESEYVIEPSKEADIAFYSYLAMSIKVDQGGAVFRTFIKKINDREPLRELLSLNPWTYETYDLIEYGRSSIEAIKRLKELEKKVKKETSTQEEAGFKEYKRFLQFVYKRSLTMGRNVVKALRKNNEPMAMIIGAAHTQDITDFFDRKGVCYYVLEPSGLKEESLWSNLTGAEYSRKQEGKSVIEHNQIAGFFMANRNLRPTYNIPQVKNQRDFYVLARRMIVTPPSGTPPKYPANFSFSSKGLRIVEDSIEIIKPGDFLYCVENSNGGYLYVRIMPNEQNYRFESLRFAFEDIIAKLSRIRDSNMSLKEQAKAMNSIIEVVNIFGRVCVFAMSAEELRTLTPETF